MQLSWLDGARLTGLKCPTINTLRLHFPSSLYLLNGSYFELFEYLEVGKSFMVGHNNCEARSVKEITFLPAAVAAEDLQG